MVVESMELGLVFWAEQQPAKQLEQLKSYGLHSAQFGVPPELELDTALETWTEALRGADLKLTGAVCAYQGEDYANLAKVHETVGFTAPGFAEERIARTKQVSAFARQLGLDGLSCHIGFIPEATSAPQYAELLAIARELCDACAANGQNFVLETGQESAQTLLRFIADVQRPNLKVNFDPANIVLYGSGDPLQALSMLAPHVVSVHSKDGRSPAGPGMLGSECRLGDGEVDFPGFLALLQKIGYRGPLTIEREEADLSVKDADIRTAITRLRAWKQALC